MALSIQSQQVQVCPRDVLDAQRALSFLSRARDLLTLPLSRAAHVIVSKQQWKQLGYANVDDFARERADRSGRWLHNLAVLQEALQDSNALAEAICGSDGLRPLGRSAAIVIARAYKSGHRNGSFSIDTWIATARQLSVNELKSTIRQAQCALAAAYSQTDGDASTQVTPDARVQRDGSDRWPIGGRDCRHELDPETSERAIVEFPAVGFIPRAFRELWEVHKAMTGSRRLDAFVEALTAEWRSGAALHVGESLPSRPRDARMRRVGRRDRSRPTGRREAPRHCLENEQPESHFRSRVVQNAQDTLVRFQKVLEHLQAERVDMDEPSCFAATSLDSALECLQQLILLEEEIETEIADLVLELDERPAWRILGFKNAVHYGEERLGMSPTTLRRRLKLARGLQTCPELRTSSKGLGLHRRLQLVGELDGRRVTRERLEEHREHVCKITMKRIEDETRERFRRAEARAHARELLWHTATSDRFDREVGEGAERDPRLAVHRMLQPTEEVLRPLTDAEWQGSLRRAYGDARSFLAEHSSGLLHALTRRRLGASVFLRVQVDAELAADFLHCIEEARHEISELAVAASRSRPAEEARLPLAVRVARTYVMRQSRVPAWVGLLAMLEAFAEEYDNPARIKRRPTDRVLIRDGWRCTAPGCTRRLTETHHVVYRSTQGGDEDQNRTCLCPFHHRMGEHGVLTSVRGHAPLALTWRLGKDGLAQWFRNERRIAPATTGKRWR